MHHSSEPLLRIRGLRKSFGGVRAVDGVDLDVWQGEVVAVIGPNGSGKTTTFNVLTGLVAPNSGTMLWNPDGIRTELSGKPAWRIFSLSIARTFQNVRLPLGLTVVENVMVGLYAECRTNWCDTLFGTARSRCREAAARERALEAICFVGGALAKYPDRLVAELSYADRRRVEIARAIASRPKLLLLDEPTAGMNPGETDELAYDIRRIKERGTTVVLVEHKMKFIGDLASRVVVLNFGRKIAEGSYDEIRSDPAVVEAYLGRRRAA